MNPVIYRNLKKSNLFKIRSIYVLRRAKSTMSWIFYPLKKATTNSGNAE